MGIFGAAVELDARLFGKLANRDKYSARKLAREQAFVLSSLRSGEVVHGIGVDVTGSFGVSVVTNERVFQANNGRIINEASAERVNRTRVLVRQNGNYLVAIDGPGLHTPTFYDAADAHRFSQAIDRHLPGPVAAPRGTPRPRPACHCHRAGQFPVTVSGDWG
jgi:hypothetical protein